MESPQFAYLVIHDLGGIKTNRSALMLDEHDR